MNNAEVLPPQAMSPEDTASRLPIAEVAHAGSAVMHESVGAQLNADQQSKIEEQIAASDVREQAQTVIA